MIANATTLQAFFQSPDRRTRNGHGIGRWVLALAAALALLPGTADSALPDKQAIVQVGYANKASTVPDPMRLVIREKDPANPNKLIERDVTVTNIPLYVAPTPKLGETAVQFAARVVAAQEAHSKEKADKIAQAINTTLGAGRATVQQVNTAAATGSPQWNIFLPGLAPIPIRNGQVTISGAHAVVYGPSAGLLKVHNDDIRAAKDHNRKNPGNKIPVPEPLKNNHTGETGDGVRIGNGPGIPPPPAGTSPGSRGMMGTMNYDLEREFPGEFTHPPLPMVATGLDSRNNASLIEFGIREIYVASLFPVAGQTDEQIYMALETLLDSNGLPASYSSFSRTLTLDGTFDSDYSLYWSATDTGFQDYLMVEFGSPIPEPEAYLYLLAGLAIMVIRLRAYGRARRSMIG